MKLQLDYLKVYRLRVFYLFIALSLGFAGHGQSYEQDTIVAYLLKEKSQMGTRPISITKLQQKKIDSLSKKIEDLRGSNDSLLVRTFESLSVFYDEQLEDLVNAKKMSDSILVIAKRTNNHYFFLLAYLGIGAVWYKKGNYPEAAANYELALGFTQKSKIEKGEKIRMEGNLLANLGATFQLMNDLDNATQYYLKGIEGLLNAKDSNGLASTYYNLGYVYSDINDWKTCYNYTREGLKFKISNSINYAVLLSRMASVCIELGSLKEASRYLMEAERYTLGNESSLNDLNYHSAKGQYYRFKGQYSQSEQQFIKAYKESIDYGDPYWVAVQARELGLLYLATKNYELANHFLHIAKDVAIEFAYQPQVRQSFSDLSDLAAARGQMSEALMYKSRQISYNDSLVKKQNHNRILYYNAKFEADKKQNEIIQLQKDNEIKNLTIQQSTLWLYFSLAGTFAIIIVGLLVYFNMKYKQDFTKHKNDLQLQQIRELEKDKQLILADAILKGQEQERGRIAKDLHDGLGGLLSGVKISLSRMKNNLVMSNDYLLVYNRSLDMLDNSINELRRVSYNMMPDSLMKFGLSVAVCDFCDSINKIKALEVQFQSVGSERRLELSHEIIMYRIVQELVNNALKHASATHLIVQLMYELKSVSITVEDNGSGFEKSKLTQSTGSGWHNVQSRVEYLKGKMDLIAQPGEGTFVHIYFPL
jgi:two-component system NarL family sensor kinase